MYTKQKTEYMKLILSKLKLLNSTILFAVWQFKIYIYFEFSVQPDIFGENRMKSGPRFGCIRSGNMLIDIELNDEC
jgi:hypothetical protein